MCYAARLFICIFLGGGPGEYFHKYAGVTTAYGWTLYPTNQDSGEEACCSPWSLHVT